jgi:hypothetical protein
MASLLRALGGAAVAWQTPNLSGRTNDSLYFKYADNNDDDNDNDDDDDDDGDDDNNNDFCLALRLVPQQRRS